MFTSRHKTYEKYISSLIKKIEFNYLDIINQLKECYKSYLFTYQQNKTVIYVYQIK